MSSPAGFTSSGGGAETNGKYALSGCNATSTTEWAPPELDPLLDELFFFGLSCFFNVVLFVRLAMTSSPEEEEDEPEPEPEPGPLAPGPPPCFTVIFTTWSEELLPEEEDPDPEPDDEDELDATFAWG